MPSAICPSISRPLMTGGRRMRARRLRAGDGQRLHDLREVAGAGMPLAAVDERRLLLCTDRLGLPTPRPEPAAGGRICRARHVTLEHDSLSLAALCRLLDRNRR